MQFFHHPNRFFSPKFPRILHGKTTIFSHFPYDFYGKTQPKNIITPGVFGLDYLPPAVGLWTFGDSPRNGVVDEGNATLGNIHWPWKLMLRCATTDGWWFLDPQSDLVQIGDWSFMELGVPRAQPWPLIVEGRGPLKTGTYKTRVIWVPLWNWPENSNGVIWGLTDPERSGVITIPYL